MKATDLLQLAYEERACAKGLAWLRDWLKKNPRGTAERFFKEKGKKLEKNIVIAMIDGDVIDINDFDEESFLRWCYISLIDWNSKQIYTSKLYSESFQQVFHCNGNYITSKQQLADALALAFKRGYLME